MKTKCIVVSEDVYWYLVERKFKLRAHSIDEVLRIEMPKMSETLEQEPPEEPVKIYSFER